MVLTLVFPTREYCWYVGYVLERNSGLVISMEGVLQISSCGLIVA